MEKIIFFSTHCPKCKILSMKLGMAGIEYEECNDVDLMLSKGIQSAPALEVDGQILEFGEAIKWVNNILKK